MDDPIDVGDIAVGDKQMNSVSDTESNQGFVEDDDIHLMEDVVDAVPSWERV